MSKENKCRLWDCQWLRHARHLFTLYPSTPLYMKELQPAHRVHRVRRPPRGLTYLVWLWLEPLSSFHLQLPKAIFSNFVWLPLGDDGPNQAHKVGTTWSERCHELIQSGVLCSANVVVSFLLWDKNKKLERLQKLYTVFDRFYITVENRWEMLRARQYPLLPS